MQFQFEGDATADTLLTDVDLTTLPQSPHIVHGGTLGLFRGQTVETLARLAEHHEGLVSLDPNVRPQIIDDRDRWDHFHRRWLAHADIYKASDEDLEWIWPNRSTDAVALELLATGVPAVIVTNGAKDLTVVTDDGELQVDAPKVDTVGAGETSDATVLRP